jgi:hypothetical protein
MSVTKKSIVSNASFYNAIAETYNSFLTDQDEVTRKTVREIFETHVVCGPVIDFGGGTGLDIPWLLNTYKVYFIEPSEGMRAKVPGAFTSSVNFSLIETDIDFRLWSPDKLPVPEKVNGVLANFAVLNCIDDLSVFFEKISLVMNPQARLVVTVIDPVFSAVVNNYSLKSAVMVSLLGILKIFNRHNGVYHPTFIHSLKALQKHAAPFFLFESHVVPPGSNFRVLIFQRK